MKLNLKSTDEEIKKKFKSLNTLTDIAILLEVPRDLLKNIIIRNKNANYTSFTLLKKNGKERVIYKPQKNLAIIQKKLSYILDINYNVHTNAHGFTSNRSIKSNASTHLKSKNVLNLDLENFFESISFGRVITMFKSYFGFNKNVAATLANICCHYEGFLPQGSAVSPIISNIIAFRLDKEFTKLAKRYHCTYTRYADDITFSTKKSTFPEKLAIKIYSDVQISQEIKTIIEKNGFKINDEKIRLDSQSSRMSVTGIKVNAKLNVDRKYIRKIRSILHCIEKNKTNLKEAERMFEEKYSYRIKKENHKPEMFDILRGMISHVGFVKGKDDPVFIKLALRYNECVDNQKFKPIKTKTNIQLSNTYVIESDFYNYYVDGQTCDTCLSIIDQGTGFMVKGIGLITNYHVLENYIMNEEQGFPHKQDIKIHRSRYSDKEFTAKLLVARKDLDIAILKINDLDHSRNGFEYNLEMKSQENIELLGFPEYTEGMDLSVKTGKLLGQRTLRVGVDLLRYEITPLILGGNSGGPIVNNQNQVIAIAARGKNVVPNEVIPIKEAIDLYYRHMEERKKHEYLNESSHS